VVLLGNIAFGLCAAAALLLIPTSLTALTAVLFAGFAVNNLTSSALGALLSAFPASVHGRASGWFQAGNVGLGAVVGGSAIWFAANLSIPALAAGTLGLVAISVTVVLLVREPARARLPARPLFAALARELRTLVSERETALGLLFFLSPACAFGASGLAASLGPDFRASAAEVAWVNGLAAGLCCTAGSFLGGYVSDRINRLTAYGVCGFLAAAPAVYMGLAPATPTSYAVGFLGYAVANGFGYAALTALLLDIASRRKYGVATVYSFLGASANLPVVYMTLLDGVGYKYAHVRGLMGFDAATNAISAVVLLLIAGALRKRWRPIALAS
jgi:MFS transporter, PAT family, beta-lactamase induction signal transducer AmpG